MQPSRAGAIDLTCHPDTPSSAVHHVDARVCRQLQGRMQITYALRADFGRLCIPPPAIATRTDRLWQHTCFELFIRRHGSPAYHELNFSPSRAWAAYSFARYREGAAPAEQAMNPHIETERSADLLTLNACVRVDVLFPELTNVTLDLAISAVIEERDGRLTYWALRHPPGKPDFHHSDAFALELHF